MNNTTFTPTADVLAIGTYYIATNYGIHPDNDATTNTENFQDLVDQVSSNGGGTIYFPVGTYNFAPLPLSPQQELLEEKERVKIVRYAIDMKSNVSIVGENIEKTILRQPATLPYSLFYYRGDDEHPITGCTYSHFTVDASATQKHNDLIGADGSIEIVNSYYGKAFYYQYVEDCVFRDLLLKNTVATALGIDFLNRVVIENVNCTNCGKQFNKDNASHYTGSAGIGIGTGGWDNENFYIHNCTCDNCGQYGIFIENQPRFYWGGNTLYSKGCVISNCVTRNGLYRGIGVRGGQYVTVIGCESYENAADGIYLDGYCKNVKISNCNSAANANGIYLTDEIAGNKFEKIVFSGNVIEENTEKGILIDGSVTDLVITNNHVKGNATALHVSANAYIDCIVKDNVFFGTIENHGSYAGNLQHNELLKDCDFCLSIPYGDFTHGFKIHTDGTVKSQNFGMITDYIDISDLTGNSFNFGLNERVNMFRVAQYDANKSFILESAPYYQANTDGSFDFARTLPKYSGAKYIRVFVEYSSCPLAEDFFVSIYN